MANEILIELRAAGSVNRELALARNGMGEVQQAAERTGRGLGQATYAARLMTGQLVNELNPALGNIVSSTAMAARGLQNYSVAVAAVGIGTAAAVAVITQLVSVSMQAARTQAQLNIAIESLNTGVLRSKLAQAVEDLRTFTEAGKSAAGSFGNIFTTIAQHFSLMASPLETIIKTREGLAKTQPIDTERIRAEQAVREGSARAAFIEPLLSQAELQNVLPLYERYIKALGDIIDLQEKAEQDLAIITARRSWAEANVLGLGDIMGPSIDAQIQGELATAMTRADAARRALQMRAEAGGLGIRQRRRDQTDPLFDIGEPSMTVDPAFIARMREAAEGPMVTFALSLERIRKEADLMGIEFDDSAAELDAVKRAILEFNPAVENAEARLAGLNVRFQELKNLDSVKTEIKAVFSSLNQTLAYSVQGVIQGTQTIETAFANMGRNIAASLLQSVINQGLKVVQDALIKFLNDLEKYGLIETLARLGISIGGATASAGAGAGAGGYTGGIGTEMHLQHGGIVTRPTMALIGEAGPEAVVPLGGGMNAGPMVEVNIINNAPGTTTEHRERTADGRRIHDIIIQEVQKGGAMGELDNMFGTFGGRRVPAQR